MPVDQRDYAGLPDASQQDRDTVQAVSSFTMTSPERILAACEAVRFVVQNGIPGSIVECGVWRGGSSMAMARTLQAEGNAARELVLFDTFEGMSEPSPHDVSLYGDVAARDLALQGRDSMLWAVASLADVRSNMARVQYPEHLIRYVPGRVEDTLPAEAPEEIAVLRLDTDWYESTRHELETLADRVSPGGILIIDDYGHWQGARRAVDEWVARRSKPVFLARVDYTGRVAVLS